MPNIPPPTFTLPVSSSSQVANNILSTVSNGIIQAQIQAGLTPTLPDVSSGSLIGLFATAIGNEVGSSNNVTLQALNQQMADTAAGSNLDRWLNIYNISRRVASPAVGNVIVTTSPLSAMVYVPAGTQLISVAGLRYATLLGGMYGNNSSIQVIGVDVGSDTNLPAGSVLNWTTPPAYFNPQAIVSTLSPLTGGADAESDGVARQRLFAFFANPPVSGNPSQIIAFAQAASPEVQTAYVSPAARGPATVDVVVVGYASSTDASRQLNSTILTNTVAPYVAGNLPTAVDTFVTNTNDYLIDLSIQLSLPFPPTASPPGPGGGWLDPAPWKVTSTKPMIRIVDGYAISGSTSGVPQNTPNSFWIDMPISVPIAGTVYNISMVSPTDLTYYSAQTNGTYLSASSYPSLSGHTSLYYITLNSPFYDSVTLGTAPRPGSVVFPTATNTPTYISALLGYLATLGPGERISVGALLPRAYRQPSDSISGNYILNGRAVKPIIDSGPEVYDGDLYYVGLYTNTTNVPVYDGASITDSTSFTYYDTLTIHSDPAFAINAPPTAYLQNGNNARGPSYVFIPQNIGIYAFSNG